MWGAPEPSSLVTAGRSTRSDWVEATATLQEIGELMVAMANTAGGTLLIGVDSAGQVSGVDDTEETIDRVIQAALAAEPSLIIPVPRTAVMDKNDIVVVQIPAGLPSVYAFDGRYLQRTEDQNTPLNPRDLRRLMLERGELSFETEVAAGTSRDDLDWDKAADYVKKLRGIGQDNVEEVLIKRGCLTRQSGDLRPTNAGLLLFGKDPQRYIASSEITAVRFAGDTMTDTHTRQDITGTLIDQIRRAETFLFDHLRKAITLEDKMARRENYEYPMEAARELVVNAVAHRDYSIRGDSIRLFVFSNRMEVHSPGGLPGPVTIDNIKDERFSRNPIIVQVLSDLHFIERLGYGVDRVLELMKEQNLNEPEFQERGGGFSVVLHNAAVKPLETITEAESDTQPEIVTFDGSYQGVEINPRQEGALSYLINEGNSRITNSELKALFPDVHPETIRRDLVDLVNKDILVKMGQKRGSYYILKDKSTTPKPETTTDT